LTDRHLLEPSPQLLEGVTQMFVEFGVPGLTFAATMGCPFPVNVICGAPVAYQL